jgi:hypothetical protein
MALGSHGGGYEEFYLWDIKPCSPIKDNRSFGWTPRFHLQGLKNNPAWKQMVNRAVLATCFHAGFLLGVFFDPEDGVDKFIWYVCWLSKDYRTLCPRRYSTSGCWLLYYTLSTAVVTCRKYTYCDMWAVSRKRIGTTFPRRYDSCPQTIAGRKQQSCP